MKVGERVSGDYTHSAMLKQEAAMKELKIGDLGTQTNPREAMRLLIKKRTAMRIRVDFNPKFAEYDLVKISFLPRCEQLHHILWFPRQTVPRK